MAILAVVKPKSTLNVTNDAGSDLTRATPDASAGDTFLNDGKTILILENVEGTPVACTVIADSIKNCDQDQGHDAVATMGTSGSSARQVLGPFNPDRFNDGANLVKLSYTGTTTGLRITPVSFA